jgi:hypothetical protein
MADLKMTELQSEIWQSLLERFVVHVDAVVTAFA